MSTPKVDREKCIGCGTCASLCGEVFELKDDGKSHVKPGADCEKAGCCKEAADSCPVKAITLE
jgi:ferredoxin